MTCPFTGEHPSAVSALNPDVTVVHAQRADREGNVQLWGIVGIQKEAVLAANRAVATVEEVVDHLDRVPGDVVLPSWCSPPSVPCRAAPTRRTPTATALGTTASTEPGTASAATGIHSRRGSTVTFATLAITPSTWPGWPPVMAETGWTADEMMTVAAARALPDRATLFVGIGLPSTAANLARLAHAPNLVLIYESGTIGSRPSRLPLSIGDGMLANTVATVVSVPEIFAYWLQPGRIDIGFLGQPRSTAGPTSTRSSSATTTARRCACPGRAARSRSPPPPGR